MINREMKSVSVISYAPGTDSYGQPRTGTPTYRTIQMMIKVYQSGYNVNDVRFNDSTHIGITYDKDITDANQIKDGDDVYNILYVIPSSRYQQVFLKKV